MKYVKVYDKNMRLVGVADIDKNYDKTGYVQLFDKATMRMIGVVNVDDISEVEEDKFVHVFDKDLKPVGFVVAAEIKHSDGFLIKLQKDPSTTGTVTGGGRFIEGTEITVVATPDSSSEYTEFDGWYEDGVKVSENTSYTFTVDGARTLVAKFKVEPLDTILYRASAKLDTTQNEFEPGIHTDAFNTTIKSHTFEDGIGTITFNDSVTTIGYNAFYDCINLTSITIPNSVTSIGVSAFFACSGLTSITIPNNVTSIGNYAFLECSGLTSINIPSSVTSIGEKVFEGCTSLTSITIPDSVTSIGNEAFYGCTGLTSIIIPNSVTSIGSIAFYECTGLISVVAEMQTPFAFGNNAFGAISNSCVLTVPSGTRDAYIAAGWTTDVFKGGVVEASAPNA